MPRPSILSAAELNALMPRLVATANMLQKLTSGKGGSASAPRAARAGGRRRREAAGDAKEIENKIVAAIKGGKNGASTAEIASKTGLRKERIFYYLKKMQTAKRVKMTGKKNNSRWHA